MKIPKLGTLPIGYQILFRIKLFGFVLELQREVFVEVMPLTPEEEYAIISEGLMSSQMIAKEEKK